MIAPGLSPLLFPQTLDRFLARDWKAEPFTSHDLKIPEIQAIPCLSSLDDLLLAWPKQVQVHLPDVADESSSINASPQDARKLFANGMALLFNDAQILSPILEKWLRAISGDLGLPNSTHSRCMLYATPDGKGTAAHFDQNINFVLQLHGTKTWWLAPNRTVENPTARHTLGQPIDEELGSYLENEMPETMPEPAEKFVLKPGSMLFVPRGWWHRTSAEGEALALNFTFSQPTWADLFTLALKSRLLLSPEWRELADGVSSSDEHRRDEARGRLDLLLVELVHDLPNWRAEDILGSTEGVQDAREAKRS